MFLNQGDVESARAVIDGQDVTGMGEDIVSAKAALLAEFDSEDGDSNE